MQAIAFKSLAVLLVILFSFSSLALAQDTETMIEIQILGTVESVDSNTLVVDGVTVNVDAALDLSAVAVGDYVKIVGYLMVDDTIQATNFELAEADDDMDDDDTSDDTVVTICHVPPGNPANAHTLYVGEAAVDAHLQNHGDIEGPCPTDDDTTEICDTTAPSPIANSLANEFDYEASDIQIWSCEGYSFTDITLAILLAERFTDDVDSILLRLDTNETWDVILINYEITQVDLMMDLELIGDEEVTDDMPDDADDGDDASTVAICHIPPGNPANAHTIYVGEAATNAHMNHGDTMGPCANGDVNPTPDSPTPDNAPTPEATLGTNLSPTIEASDN